VFVVLHVVLSMLLVSAVVVYVGKEQNFKQQLADTKSKSESEERKQSAALAEAQNAQAATIDQMRVMQGQATALTTQLAASEAKIAGLGVQLAEASANNSLQQANATTLTSALQAAQGTTAKLQEIVVDLRKANDTLVQRNVEADKSIADLTNKVDVLDRDGKYLREQLTQVASDAEKLGAAVRATGADPKSITGGPINVAGATPSINGVVRDVRTIESLPYATISVGSADSVTKGMKFNVIDRAKGEFLGVIEVVSVEPNEATGRVTGPKIADIGAGAEVRTQL